MAETLDSVRGRFPGFLIWREFAGDRLRYVARRAGPGAGLHTVVSADLGELHDVLSAASAADPAPEESPQRIAEDFPGWGVRYEGGKWTAWCPAITVQAASPAAVRALIEHAITGNDPEWRAPA